MTPIQLVTAMQLPKLVIYTGILISILTSCGGSDKTQPPQKNFMSEDEYFSRVYQFSDTIFDIVAKTGDFETAGEALSFIGEYKKSLIEFDKTSTPYSEPNKYDSAFVKNSKQQNAVKYIVDRCSKEKLICINEAHHQPCHRVFVQSLLPALSKNGFKYLALETITNTKEDEFAVNSNKYPSLANGYYSREPQYGNLIRTALEYGFTIVPYETNAQTDSLPNDREIVQARNIAKILKKDTAAKILIYGGYDHIYEIDIPGFGTPMASHLKSITGIDPYTIDQVTLSEHGASNYNHPIYNLVNINESTIFPEFLNKTTYDPTGKFACDIYICHPKTNYLNGRPNWLINDKRKQVDISDKITVKFPVMIFAYKSNEYSKKLKLKDQPVPVDIVEVKKKADMKSLILEKGNYTIIIKSAFGSVQSFFLLVN